MHAAERHQSVIDEGGRAIGDPLWRLLGALAVLIVIAPCWADAQVAPIDPASLPGVLPTGLGESVDRDVARVRAATARFTRIDEAVAAGYAPTAVCVAHPQHGGMGFHYKNRALYDATLDPESPEILLYEKMPDGTFRLNGVEYIVPISAWTRNEPPATMGQRLTRSEELGVWYLHAWIWESSPLGLFADWNPRVKCFSD